MIMLLMLPILGMLWMLFSRHHDAFLRKGLLPFTGLIMIFSWYFSYLEVPGFGKGFLVFDQFSYLMSGLIILVSVFFMVLLIQRYVKEGLRYTHPVALLIFSTVGALLLVSWAHFLILFLAIEILSIPLYALVTGYLDQNRSQEAGLKYFLIGSFASVFLLLGMALYYAGTGMFILSPEVLVAHFSSLSLSLIGLVLILASLLFKLGVVPFQFWIADVYEGAPSPILGWMSNIVKIALVGRFLTPLIVFPGLWDQLLFFVCVLTCVLGNVYALLQVSFKRWIAYSGLAHLGYILFVFLPFLAQSSFVVFMYFSAYVLGNLGLFGALHWLTVSKGIRIKTLSDFKGLFYQFPKMSMVILGSLFSLAGIPPFPGFWAKVMIILPLLFQQNIALLVVAIFSFLIGVYYYLKVALSLFSKD